MHAARRYPAGVRRLAALTLAGLCALALSACGDTLQVKPISHHILEGLVQAPYAVYWLGGTFHGLGVSEASKDTSGAYSVQYGSCIEGGQGNCVAPLRVVTSPDNSFLPGGSTPSRHTTIRGQDAVVAENGRAIVIATGVVVLDIYARNAQLARAAAQTAVPINEPGAPEAALPARLPDTGFGNTPLPSQVPNPLHPVT
jgi:hypothetical protein